MTDPANTNSLYWGVSTLGCAELSLPEICELLGEFRLRELELRAVQGRVDLPRWAVETGWSPTLATAYLADHNVRFRVAGSSFKLVGNDPKSRAELVEFCDWADSWGAMYVRTFGGGTWGKPLSSDDLEHAAQAVKWWQQERRSRGWKLELLLETHDAFSASPPFLELLARLDEPIGVIWDSHHTWRLGSESPRDSWSQLSEWVRHVHLKDSVSCPSARHPFTYVLPGDGEVPLQEILSVLQDNQFQGVVSLEWERLWHPYLPPLRKALKRLRELSWLPTSAHEHQPAVVAS